MKKYTVLFCCCLILFTAFTVHAQQGGFTGPTVTTGQQVSIAGQHGFFGPIMNATVAQIVNTFPRDSEAILRGYITQRISNDRYVFRDAAGGEMVIKIKNDRWWGLTVGPNNLVEIGGKVKRNKNTGIFEYFDAKNIRLAQ